MFFGSAVAVAVPPGAAWPPAVAWSGAAVMWLVFLHLRLFDEHKDAEADRAAYPDRLLTRGVVTLPLLRNVAVGAILIQAGLSALIGPRALVAWLAVVGFTLLMRVEFGIGRWLSARIVWYAVLHNPVVALLAVYAWACTGAEWAAHFWPYVLTVSVASLAFEVGRKTRLPDEELAGVPSYTSVHGRPAVMWSLRALAVATLAGSIATILARAGLAAATTLPVAAGLGLSVLALVIALGLFSGERPAKKVELGGTLLLLLSLLGMGVAAW